jgi:nicotinate-nucleotide pyrophosphorylase (carboxylating)
MKHLSDYTPDDLAALAQADVARALAEDVGGGDLTAALVDATRGTRARILARESAVVCGRPWVEAAVRACDPDATLHWQVAEGDTCHPDQVVLEIEGRAQALLTAERTALNFLQLLSAVATKTASYVDAVRGTRAAIVDTRKTLPGLRLAQKYAVKVGGGVNHRIGLYDAVLIKENHIAAAGGVSAVLQRVRETAPQARFVAQMVLLDNMPLDQLHEAVRRNAARAVLEISGGVNLSTVRQLAETGVDRISIGSLTKDVKAIDYSMRFAAL